MENLDLKKLKKDLLNIAGPSGIQPFIVSVDSASEKELLKLAKDNGLDISDYKKEK